MGLYDRIQNAAAGYAGPQAAASAADLAGSLPDGAAIPRRDTIPLSPRFTHSTVEAYIATVGLAPEDVFAVIPELSNDVAIAFTFIYRDRPEYEEGRSRWAASAGT
jgi:hypothetical protein